jgi:hypothetical protein
MSLKAKARRHYREPAGAGFCALWATPSGVPWAAWDAYRADAADQLQSRAVAFNSLTAPTGPGTN